jgi:hypothetical protein
MAVCLRARQLGLAGSISTTQPYFSPTSPKKVPVV